MAIVQLGWLVSDKPRLKFTGVRPSLFVQVNPYLIPCINCVVPEIFLHKAKMVAFVNWHNLKCSLLYFMLQLICDTFL